MKELWVKNQIRVVSIALKSSMQIKSLKTSNWTVSIVEPMAIFKDSRQMLVKSNKMRKLSQCLQHQRKLSVIDYLMITQ